ncbi:MAG: hypothetical protein F6K50_48045 [Moorea sp. SIO3I7]|uniref:hypothetical protein n=1 Tax=Moorena sp. SIO3I8 TaxID=2607833 RepID=UPI0013C1EEA0|nr:hypothetical protein [Moorena sp. SIO3I8]NEO02811.1 hypothetical protein [Moorena sp. SIO3I7]NEO08479.1 hypothetical protein [Moorena sp. SIO3I8]
MGTQDFSPLHYSLLPTPCSLLPAPCSLLPIPCSLFPIPYSQHLLQKFSKNVIMKDYLCYNKITVGAKTFHGKSQPTVSPGYRLALEPQLRRYLIFYVVLSTPISMGAH